MSPAWSSARTWVRVPAVCWVLATAMLVGVALAAPGMREDLPGAPAAGGLAFWLGLVVLALQAAALSQSPRHPAIALLAVAVAAPLGALAGLGSAIGCTTVMVVVGAYAAVTRRRTGAGGTWLALGAAAVLVAVGDALAQVDTGEEWTPAVLTGLVQGFGTVGLAALVAMVVASRREALTAAEDRARAVAGEQAALVDAAVSRERTAMARELHDIAAHHLSGIAVMSAAIGRQIDKDPEGAKLAVAQVREQSTAMLRDMRGLVGLLRPPDTALEAADPHMPVQRGVVREESFDGIAALVDAAVERGQQVTFEVVEPGGTDPRDAIGPLAQLSAYRTAQEALTNAARHAPGTPCRVVVDASRPDRVVLTVANGVRPGARAAATTGGFGLVGMRERAELTDSRLTCGLVGEEWVVTLDVPVRDQARLPPRPSQEDAT